jgi:hypothetical protein
MNRPAIPGSRVRAPLAFLLLPLFGTAAAGWSAEQAPAAALAPQPAVQGYRIEDWKALSNEALIIRTNDGRRYRATLMGKCIGLKFTDTIAFVTRGERTVDRFAGIMLPDGSRCYFKTLEAISQPTDSRDGAPR